MQKVKRSKYFKYKKRDLLMLLNDFERQFSRDTGKCCFLWVRNNGNRK